MKRLIILVGLLIGGYAASAQFPTTDSLERFINRYIRNSAVESFQNLRMNTALIGVLRFIDSAYGGQIASISATSDTTFRIITLAHDTLSTIVVGRRWTLQQVLTNGSILTTNSTISLADSITFSSGKVLIDQLRLTGLVTQSDTTTYKPLARDALGNTVGFDRWPGSGSPFTGFRLGDSTITNEAQDPADLTWKKIHSQRYFRFIDENFIHYRSHFDVAELGDLTTVNGTTPTTVDGQLNIVGDNTFLSTNTAPITPWYSVELDISLMTEGSGTSTQVGPALIKDASHYVACTYDNTTDSCRIMMDGNVLFSKYVVLPSSNLVLYMVATGNTVAMWAKYSNKTVFIGTVELGFDPTVVGALDGYKYGILTYSQAGSPTQIINSLRGGANGGVGLLNTRLVTNEDGSPYQFGNKVLFTADWAGVGPWTYNNYTTENSTVFAMDLENFQIETVGRIFFNRDDPKDVGAFKITPGAAVKLTWFPSRNQWLMTMNYSDWQNGSSGNTLPSNSDSYAWLDWEAPFGERVFQKSQLQTFGINRTTNPYLDFDTKVAYINGTYYVVSTEAQGVNEGATTWSATGGWPILFSGPDLSNLTLVRRENTGTAFYEAGTFAKYKGNWYIIFSTYGDTRLVCYDLGLNKIDTLNLPFASNSEIPGYDWLVRQKNGRSEYLLIGYDTKNLTLNGNTYAWSRGELVVFKSDTVGSGYEFPNRIANSITMPTKEHRVLSSNAAAITAAGSTGDVQIKDAGGELDASSDFKFTQSGSNSVLRLNNNSENFAAVAVYLNNDQVGSYGAAGSNGGAFANKFWFNSEFRPLTFFMTNAAGTVNTPMLEFNTDRVARFTKNGTFGTMSYPYEAGVFTNSGDTKLGIYTQSATAGIGEGASLTFGANHYTMANGKYPGFDMQFNFNSTAATNTWSLHWIDRNFNGTVNNYLLDLLKVTGTGQISTPYITRSSTPLDSGVHVSPTGEWSIRPIAGGSLSGSGTSGQLTLWDGTSSATGNSNILWGTSNGPRISVGTTNTQGVLNVGGNKNLTASGAQSYFAGAIYTDQVAAASGTASSYTINYIASPTIAAANTSVTFPGITTFAVEAPTAGTNATITNAYAFQTGSNGHAKIQGNLEADGALMAGGAQYNAVTTITADATLATNVYWVNINANSGNVTVTLPAASSVFNSTRGITYIFSRVDNTANTVTIQRAGSDTIESGTSFTLTTQWEKKKLQCTANNQWQIEL